MRRLRQRHGRASSRLRWRKTGDWPGANDNRIAYQRDGSYYLLESDGDGQKWYVRRYTSGGDAKHIDVFTTLGAAQRRAAADAGRTG